MSCGFGMADFGMMWLMGRNVSKPLEMSHGRPFFLASFWMLRAVMSMASA